MYYVSIFANMINSGSFKEVKLWRSVQKPGEHPGQVQQAGVQGGEAAAEQDEWWRELQLPLRDWWRCEQRGERPASGSGSDRQLVIHRGRRQAVPGVCWGWCLSTLHYVFLFQMKFVADQFGFRPDSSHLHIAHRMAAKQAEMLARRARQGRARRHRPWDMRRLSFPSYNNCSYSYCFIDCIFIELQVIISCLLLLKHRLFQCP